MLNIPGANVRFCDGITRRDFLRIGSLGMGGLSLPGLLGARAAQAGTTAAGGLGRAKSCILLFMGGGPPQQHTFDLKPDMPPEIRGNCKPIATNVPGIFISEDLPQVARQADKYAIVRSVTDEYNGGAHGQSVYLALTGHHSPRVQGDDVKPAANDFPFIGSAVARLRSTSHPVPPSVWLLEMHRRTLRRRRDPASWGRSTYPFRILQDPNKADFRVEALASPKDVSLDRLLERRNLLEQLDRRAERFLDRQTGAGIHGQYELALSMLTSNQSQRAFDLKAEPAKTRDRYGRHKFGQGVLLARRLVEHGVPLVTVYWNGDQDVNQGWDLHYDIHNRPEAADARGSTRPFPPPCSKTLPTAACSMKQLVVWMGEFGRAPADRAGGRARSLGKVLFGGHGRRRNSWGHGLWQVGSASCRASRVAGDSGRHRHHDLLCFGDQHGYGNSRHHGPAAATVPGRGHPWTVRLAADSMTQQAASAQECL